LKAWVLHGVNDLRFEDVEIPNNINKNVINIAINSDTFSKVIVANNVITIEIINANIVTIKTHLKSVLFFIFSSKN
jgi:hypothetical protein